MTMSRINTLEDGTLEDVFVVGFSGRVTLAGTPVRCAPIFALLAGGRTTFVTLQRDASEVVWAEPSFAGDATPPSLWPGEATRVPRSCARFGWEFLVLSPGDAARYYLDTDEIDGVRVAYQPVEQNRQILDAISGDRLAELLRARSKRDVERAAARLAAVTSDPHRVALAAARLEDVGSAMASDFRLAFAASAELIATFRAIR